MQNILSSGTNSMCTKLLVGTVLAGYVVRKIYMRYFTSSNFSADAVDKDTKGDIELEESVKSLEREPDWESMDIKEYTQALLETI